MSAHAHEHHVHGGPKIYGAILVALLILTGITVGASYINFGSPTANVVIAVTIATIKASLVGLFFMHLKYDKASSAVIFLGSFMFLGLLLLFSFWDISSRQDPYPGNYKGVGVPTSAATGAPGAKAPGAGTDSPPVATPPAGNTNPAPAGQH
jgi:cytochrome c oxidase subunit IV